MNPKSKLNTSNRLHAIDELRGLCLVLMVLYHLVYDIVWVYDMNGTIFYSDTMNLIRDFFAGVFIFIAGISRNLSHNNLKNALKILAGAIIVTIVTTITGSPIYFGILHFMGISILASVLFLPWLRKIPKTVFYPLIIFFIVLFKNVPNGYLGVKGLWFYELPTSLYRHLLLSPFGLPSPEFVSYDYFPLIPWFFVFLLGMYFGRNFKTDAPVWAKTSYLPALCVVGAHSLWIYLLHQPIVLGLVEVSHFVFSKF